jgi:hypothetical protein
MLFIIGAVIWPESYPGESLLVVYLYVLNIGAETVLLPLFYPSVALLRLRPKAAYIGLYFILTLAISNLIPLLLFHRSFTLLYISEWSGSGDEREQLAALLGLANPIFSFVLALVVFWKSDLWSYAGHRPEEG